MKRLKHNIKIFFSSIMALIVMITTTGFTIYSHHCLTADIHNYSLLIPADECTHLSNTDSCCALEKPACCSDNYSQEKECCTNDTVVKKLTVDSVLFQKAPILKAIELNISIDHLILNQNKLTSIDLNKQFNYNNSPPPLLTQDQLSFLQVYII